MVHDSEVKAWISDNTFLLDHGLLRRVNAPPMRAARPRRQRVENHSAHGDIPSLAVAFMGK